MEKKNKRSVTSSFNSYSKRMLFEKERRLEILIQRRACLEKELYLLNISLSNLEKQLKKENQVQKNL